MNFIIRWTAHIVFLSEKHVLHVFLSKKRLLVRHANIVQRVKSCYKIKIDYRVPVCCFYGVLLSKQHQQLTIEPLLHSDSATIRAQKRLCCITIVTVLECKSGSIAEKSGHFTSLISQRFVVKLHNVLCINVLTQIAQNSRISHQRFCCALNEEYWALEMQILCRTADCCVRQGFNKNLYPQSAYGRKSYRI